MQLCSRTSAQDKENRENHPRQVFLPNLPLAFVIANSQVSGFTSRTATVHRIISGCSDMKQFILDVL